MNVTVWVIVGGVHPCSNCVTKIQPKGEYVLQLTFCFESIRQVSVGAQEVQEVQGTTVGITGGTTTTSFHGITSVFHIILSRIIDLSDQLYHAVIRIILIG